MFLDYSTRDERYIQFAAEQAVKSNVLTFRHGCIAVVSGKIVARGYNNTRTYSKDGFIKNTCSCHAETDVLRKCYKQNINKKIILYIARISKKNTLLNSEPCVECFNLMKELNVKYIIYSTENSITKIHVNHFEPKHHSSGFQAIQNERVTLL